MKLPSRLALSRHGIYYFRLQFQIDSKRFERRVSLQTRCPHIAKAKAIGISAMMLGYNNLEANMSTFNPNDPSTWGALNNGNIQKFDAKLSSSGWELTNIQPHEVESAIKFAKGVDSITPKPQAISQPIKQATPQPSVETTGGATVDEMIKRFATRKKDALTEKSLYEYGNYHRKFSQWIVTQKRNKNLPIRLITREDIGDYIDDLKAQKLSDRTIQQKYMAALNGLFELAQSTGAYPKGDIPSKGHKLFTKKLQKKADKNNSYEPFTDNELAKIFLPDNLLKQPKPDDFWLPLLGLFTGGRISELCQLAVADIQLEGKLWSISINDEDYKRLKTDAAARVIPIHPQLIALGFLDYVEDAKQCGTMLFPYLTADRFGNFSHTSSERFAGYLDTLGISHPQKVFHSLRKTSNGKLKDNNVQEETRCQFIGHVYETTNSSIYGKQHPLPFLMKHAASKLVFESIKFDKLTYTKGKFSKQLEHLCKLHTRMKNNREAKKKRDLEKEQKTRKS